MKRILFTIILLISASRANAAIALVANVGNNCGNGTSSCTTSGINTASATLLVVVCSSTNGTQSVTDSQSSTWNSLTQQTNNGNFTQGFYSFTGNTNASHTATCNSSANAFNSISFSSWSGTLTTSSVFDAQNGGTANASTTVSAGSITPAQSGELFVTGVGNDGTPTSCSVDSSYTALDSELNVSNEILCSAYLVNSGTGAQNPTWTWNDNEYGVAVHAAFKPAGGGAACTPSLTLLGVGRC